MDNISLVSTLKNYVKEQNAPFSMPGHKYGRGFSKEFTQNIINFDMTEVEGLDNLHKPTGVILEAQTKLQKLYNSHKSYFLINGSTCGNLIMIYSSFNEGDIILVERNCHRSIFNAIIMRKLKPIYIENIYSNNLKEAIGINIESLKNKLEINKDIKGIVLTYPNYYGIGIDIDRIINICKNYNIKILIDSAHGAHFGFNKYLPKSAQDLGATMTVMSAHKTLPSFTQTAYLHLNDEALREKVEFYLGVFMSTSPSYLFMASLDYSRNFLEYEADDKYGELVKKLQCIKEKINKLDYVKVLEKKDFYQEGFNEVELDSSRLVLNLKEGYSGHKLLDYLRKNKVQSEMSTTNSVVLIPSPFNTEEDYRLLTEALEMCDSKQLLDDKVNMNKIKIPDQVLFPYEVLDAEKVYAKLEDVEGCIAGENIILYPPGVPLVVMGERFNKEHIEIINSSIKNNVTIIGVEEYKVRILR
ncbi:Arginine/lysine/ornithine decarboxylase [Clostridium cavendishii DSM 21758]|uniref:Arginine/lysine/ornithine decarboxylase n=1 Tax=Clostridium cavendishii DSM 21758 TaxID=1121302 RepID=A0A1M6V068_9CLOT|nr:aminotransferase class V-fold PLP-dependent enzyme [Clostridium cavendishii]SHK74794.1 Arginine/lysine/ornithine decarboxylase [Clostridium cavendishii DSM 21758]